MERLDVSCGRSIGLCLMCIFTATSPNITRARKRPSKMGTGVALIHSHSGAGSSSKAVATPIFYATRIYEARWGDGIKPIEAVEYLDRRMKKEKEEREEGNGRNAINNRIKEREKQK